MKILIILDSNAVIWGTLVTGEVLKPITGQNSWPLKNNPLVGTLTVYRNGLRQQQDSDYNLISSYILTSSYWSYADLIECDYIF